jgi:hypothetical protein
MAAFKSQFVRSTMIGHSVTSALTVFSFEAELPISTGITGEPSGQMCEIVGYGVGTGVGSGVGSSVGSGVGSKVGPGVGFGVGFGVGSGVGFGVGLGVGFGVGSSVGFGVGSGVGCRVGFGVGLGVGLGVGNGVGCKVSGALQQPNARFISQESAVVCVTVTFPSSTLTSNTSSPFSKGTAKFMSQFELSTTVGHSVTSALTVFSRAEELPIVTGITGAPSGQK